IRAAKEGHLAIVAQDMHFDSMDDLYAAVGYSHVTPRKILNKLYAVLHPGEPEPGTPRSVQEAVAEPADGGAQRKSPGGVGVAGVDGVLMRFAKCCSPIPGDPIVGYISRGQGITVHRADCPNVPNMEPERLISVHWEGEEEKPYAAGIFIIADNVRGTLAPVAQALADAEINIDELNLKSTVEGRSHMRLKVEVRNATQLYDIIERIRKLPNILEVVRDREDIDAPNP
ncbi:MAG: bifunctional (p)ppGpp synthetase/guanosine-3',5'-bis(diphosphate) 3'-pyrophosphohydrolase, partial [Desulfovibrio sp.]|nr:bifunctional (p)ppGpp synthetase/guanosine-3',5'-bis(diphosphate) 3'-pyrophosphohydrolase [Desulfovibrio sp.]